MNVAEKILDILNFAQENCEPLRIEPIDSEEDGYEKWQTWRAVCGDGDDATEACGGDIMEAMAELRERLIADGEMDEDEVIEEEEED